MNKLLTLTLIILTFSCSDKKNEKQIQKKSFEQVKIVSEKEKKIPSKVEIKVPNSINIDSTNYRYFNLKEFDMRGWYSGRRSEELKFPSKEKLMKLFQNERINGEFIYPFNFRYFSIQKNSPTEKILTIIESNESCCSDLHYLVYNKKNKLISDNIIAGTGGDGMWHYEQFGKFVNDSTYVLTRVDSEEIKLNESGTKTEIQIDSVITTYKFKKDKPFKILDEQEFSVKK